MPGLLLRNRSRYNCGDGNDSGGGSGNVVTEVADVVSYPDGDGNSDGRGGGDTGDNGEVVMVVLV